ncbi:Piso0_001594 [Millerozyma farinosa CBS 7064]|uniref:Piso0_001594 protein n=1 Tax=Pichia sorbitophila (strain ATCC MYA-4447 / BCRC 22081 / CBS 7064 / NBRC 10061 / NRRL Y-12695) TaxID=559304 RepID=G8YNK5_PICSO|nr:Piso0_001594 [Millerozyma farinosa CBS 7064]
MLGLSPEVAKWLYNVIEPQYINRQITYTHLYHFLEVHFDKNFRFRIKTSIFTSGLTGRSNLLINLNGSIPTGADTEVPVVIWIPHNYPYSSELSSEDDMGVPIVFVKNDISKGLYVKPGNHIDSQGKFYHPYLNSWGRDYSTNSSFYNLLKLVDVMKASFEKECPIFRYTLDEHTIPKFDNHAPSIPRKPAKIPLTADQTVSDEPIANAVALNKEPTNSHMPDDVPEKYKSPPPLPGNILESADFGRTSRHKIIERPNSYADKGSSPAASTGFDAHEIDHMAKHVDDIDLLDKSSNELGNGLNNRSDVISKKITEGINDLVYKGNDSINTKLSQLNADTSKIDTLYKQLSFHNHQAKANDENLNRHIAYLKNQISRINLFNEQLEELKPQNLNSDSKVFLSKENALDLENIIIADSPLVNQVYELSGEIRAIRDSLDLLSGKFQGENEVINDVTLNQCVKLARNLGRELFWLQMLKNDIAYNRMGLSK